MKKIISLSTRPNCPVCKQSSLIGELEQTDSGYKTCCAYPGCGTLVHLDKSWNVTYAERRYWPDGSIIGA